MTMDLQIENHSGIALVTIDNPPVNALGKATRLALADAIARLEADPAVGAIVLTGAGKMFVGGADITEFDRPPEEPHLPDLIQQIAASSKPWIAALHGTALGGGMELALGCHYRIAAPGTRLGLPEVNLGIIPGAGGTQRLPRLIGVEAAIPVVAENRVVTAGQDAEPGLIDQVVQGDLVGAALTFAAGRIGQPLPVAASARPVSATPEVWTAAEARIAKASKGNPAPLAALAVLRFGVENGAEAGLANERMVFLRLRASEEAAALRHLFFAERAAPRPADLRDVTPRTLTRAGVIGGGTMGTGIGAALLAAGLSVTLSERDEAALQRGLATLKGLVEAGVKRGLITEAQAGERLARLSGTVGLAAMAPCDLVIEAVFETLEIKRPVFAELGRICSPDAILATNTSYLDPRRIAEGLAHPDRFLGLHFFSPAHVMKLLEIVPTPDTSRQTLATAFDLARRLGKIPVRSGICDGFIGNRILRRYRAAAEDMLRQGVPVPEIDAALRAFGFAMGPFEMQDMAGLDISWLQREAARAQGETIAVQPGDLLVLAGRKGQKTGGGWYDYVPEDRKPRPSAEAARIIAPLVTGNLSLSPAEIADRLVATMAEEGRAILAEGIATQPSDIDLVEVHGYGFPRSKGGPMFLTERRGRGAHGTSAGSGYRQDQGRGCRA
ncbi:MAG: enoyl-CoA hydratase/isomerase family protein [Rhodobacteraceae bacterium]|nr:enoyl-CoA hydratase/isomerase family protein [Paracoccaceae bacterium]